METLTCYLCGNKTHNDESKVFDLYYGDGLTQERHCHECDPPDEG